MGARGGRKGRGGRPGGSAVNATAHGMELGRLSEVIDDQLGLHFPKERWGDLMRGIGAAARDLGFDDADTCAEWLASAALSRSQIEVLASHLTVGETTFFREARSLAALELVVLPELIRARRAGERRLRLWSAGCATGEEAYTLAIILSRLLPDRAEWDITILATDVNARALRKGRHAVYRPWSFRDTPPDIRGAYFTAAAADEYALLPHYRSLVTFEYLNLAEDVYPSLLSNTNAMDVILCRNVLMYFSESVRVQVIRRLHCCLADGGWLVTSACEAAMALFPSFAAVLIGGATLFRKERAPAAAAPALPPAGPEARKGRHAAASRAENHPGAPPPAGAGGLLDEAGHLLANGSSAEALECARRALEREPDSARAMDVMARACANLGRLTEALDWCERAVAADKMNPGVQFMRAMVLQELGRLDEARTVLRRVLYLDSGFALGHYALGALLRQQGRPGDANRCFAAARAILGQQPAEAVLPETDGITVGHLLEMVRSMMDREGEP